MKRLTETIVLRGSIGRLGQRVAADLAPAVRRGSARPTAGSPGPASSGRHSATPLRTAATSEWVVPRSMPTAMRRWCGSGAPPGSEICSRAIALIVPALRGADRRRRQSARRTSALCTCCAAAAVVAVARRAASARRCERGLPMRARARRRAPRPRSPSRASSSASRHSICCIRNSGGIAVLSSASIGAPSQLAQVGGALAADPSGAR